MTGRHTSLSKFAFHCFLFFSSSVLSLPTKKQGRAAQAVEVRLDGQLLPTSLSATVASPSIARRTHPHGDSDSGDDEEEHETSSSSSSRRNATPSSTRRTVTVTEYYSSTTDSRRRITTSTEENIRPSIASLPRIPPDPTVTTVHIFKTETAVTTHTESVTASIQTATGTSDGAIPDSTSASVQSTGLSSTNRTVLIATSAAGGTLALTVIAFILYRRRKRNQSQPSNSGYNPFPDNNSLGGFVNINSLPSPAPAPAQTVSGAGRFYKEKPEPTSPPPPPPPPPRPRKEPTGRRYPVVANYNMPLPSTPAPPGPTNRPNTPHHRNIPYYQNPNGSRGEGYEPVPAYYAPIKPEEGTAITPSRRRTHLDVHEMATAPRTP